MARFGSRAARCGGDERHPGLDVHEEDSADLHLGGTGVLYAKADGNYSPAGLMTKLFDFANVSRFRHLSGTKDLEDKNSPVRPGVPHLAERPSDERCRAGAGALADVGSLHPKPPAPPVVWRRHPHGRCHVRCRRPRPTPPPAPVKAASGGGQPAAAVAPLAGRRMRGGLACRIRQGVSQPTGADRAVPGRSSMLQSPVLPPERQTDRPTALPTGSATARPFARPPDRPLDGPNGRPELGRAGIMAPHQDDALVF